MAVWAISRKGTTVLLRWRFIVAAVLIAGLAGLLWLDFHINLARPGIWLVPLALTVALLAAGEVLGLMAAGNLRPLAWTVYCGTTLVVLAAAAPLAWTVYPLDCPVGRLGWLAAALAAGLMLAFIGEMQRYRQPGGVIVHVALALFVMVYVGLSLGLIVQLRMLGGNARGLVALLSMVVVVKLGDTGAYTFGRIFGRRKMAPLLSPGKTVAGAVGGLFSSCAGAWLMLAWVGPWMLGTGAAPWWSWLLYGFIVGAAGMLGDLAESLLKRDMGRKDSSDWLPGMGGVLDVIDSLLVAGPAAYVCWVTELVRL